MVYLSGGYHNDKWQYHDPLFARWPKWSDSYIYTLIREFGVAYRTNMSSVHTSVRFYLGGNVELKCDYHCLFANPAGNPVEVRGNLFIGRLIYKFGNGWSGHLLWEGFKPGEFYPSDADSYAWIRAELMFTY